MAFFSDLDLVINEYLVRYNNDNRPMEFEQFLSSLNEPEANKVLDYFATSLEAVL